MSKNQNISELLRRLADEVDAAEQPVRPYAAEVHVTVPGASARALVAAMRKELRKRGRDDGHLR